MNMEHLTDDEIEKILFEERDEGEAACFEGSRYEQADPPDLEKAEACYIKGWELGCYWGMEWLCRMHLKADNVDRAIWAAEQMAAAYNFLGYMQLVCYYDKKNDREKALYWLYRLKDAPSKPD